MTQTKAILQHLKRKPITPIQALALYGCFRLSARIYDLIKDGHNIKSEPFLTTTGKRVAKYTLHD